MHIHAPSPPIQMRGWTYKGTHTHLRHEHISTHIDLTHTYTHTYHCLPRKRGLLTCSQHTCADLPQRGYMQRGGESRGHLGCFSRSALGGTPEETSNNSLASWKDFGLNQLPMVGSCPDACWLTQHRMHTACISPNACPSHPSYTQLL